MTTPKDQGSEPKKYGTSFKPIINVPRATPPSKPVDAPQNTPDEIDKLREQLEEFALHLKPGTTKGKHRTAIFDTLELTKLVQALITAAQEKPLLELKQWHDNWMKAQDKPFNWYGAVEAMLATLTNDKIGGEHGDSK